VKELHPATTGFSAAADAYERGRPGYPEEAMAWVAERLGLGPGRDVLDLAAGTGKLTRALVPFGARVIAVEPIDEMREHLFAALPDIEAFDGTAESIPLPEGSVDAVTCGQAFHWFRVEQALR
jgi:ubiquinone/menaquinone biosynthesis C-methylase UbiE